MLDFLPIKLKKEILNAFDYILEIRIRVGLPIIVKGLIDGKYLNKFLEIILCQQDIDRIISSLSSFSIYSVEESLKNGFITSLNGERVGLCGKCVTANGENKTIKDITSLCIRMPNDVKGIARPFIKQIDSAKSCLIFSPPFQGKTTFARDLGREYSSTFNESVLFIDERDEFSAGGRFYLGKNSDVMSYSSKKFAFYNGVRSLNPTVIICDEIMDEQDLKGLEFASLSGVKIVATCHSDKIENLLKKQKISTILQKNIFDCLIEIKSGKINKIYGEKEWSNYL